MLARQCQLLALLGDLAEETRILDRQYRLARQGLHQPHRLGREFAGHAPLQYQRTQNPLGADQWHDQGRAQAGGEARLDQRRLGPLRQIGELHRGTARRRLAHRGFRLGDADIAHRAGEPIVQPGRLDQAEGALGAVVAEHGTGIRSGQSDRAGQDRRQHRAQIERRADRLPDLGEQPQFTDRLPQLGGAGAQFVEQPRILDRDHRLVGKGRDERDLLVGKRLRPDGGQGR